MSEVMGGMGGSIEDGRCAEDPPLGKVLSRCLFQNASLKTSLPSREPTMVTWGPTKTGTQVLEVPGQVLMWLPNPKAYLCHHERDGEE